MLEITLNYDETHDPEEERVTTRTLEEAADLVRKTQGVSSFVIVGTSKDLGE